MTLVVALGLGLGLFGLALRLDQASLRLLLVEGGLSLAVGPTQQLHDLLGHRVVQRVELGIALLGLGVTIAGAAVCGYALGRLRRRGRPPRDRGTPAGALARLSRD